MIVCITGATGFIGRRLLTYHQNQGDDVRYLTRGNKEEIIGAKSFTGDVTGSIANLADFLKGASLLYHCAGEVSDESLMRPTHVQGTKNLLKAVEQVCGHKQNTFHWIQLSSCGAYGQSNGSPTEERFVDEATVESPYGEYECTKTESDALVLDCSKQHSWFKYTILRPSIVFGAGMRSTAISRLASLIKKNLFLYIGNKESIANYVHVNDVVNAMVLSANNTSAMDETFIVANDCNFKEVIEAVSATLEVSKPRIVVNEFLLRWAVNISSRFIKLPVSHEHIDVLVRKTHYSNVKLIKLLNWSPASSVPVQIAKYLISENKGSND